MLQTQAPRHSI